MIIIDIIILVNFYKKSGEREALSHNVENNFVFSDSFGGLLLL